MYARQLQRQLERSSARSLRAAHSTQLTSRGGSRALERGPSGSWRGSQEGSRHGLPRRSSLPQLDAAAVQGPSSGPAASQLPSGHGVPAAADEHSAARAAVAPGQQQHEAGLQPDCEDCDLSVETCPAAVGARWLPTLMQHLGPATKGGSSPAISGGPHRSHGGAATSERRPSPSASTGPPPAGCPSMGTSSVTPQRIPSSSMPPERIPSSSSHRTLAEVRGLFDAAHGDGGGSR